jgi:predicted ATPase/DNA-binding winged helix-turn-helix (wHTH) protein
MREAYRFGPVEIRPVERLVMVGGEPVALGSRAFDVLVALVERRDRVVTKNELLDLAWPGLVVEENNLQAQVSALRRALGPHAIATVPGRGYRFSMASGHASPAGASASTPFAPSADLRRGLPRLAAPLIGRDDELAALDRLIEQHRLVTIGGAAGIGKTSIAHAVAEERLGKLRDGVVWAELAPIWDAALVPAVIAKALQVQAPPGTDVTAPLMAAVRNLEALIVIDTAEHVLEAVAQVVNDILAHAPRVTVLVTSRAALKLKQERLMRLGPLGVPEPGVGLEEARTFGAIALIEERARALNPRFVLTEENVALAIEVCRHLDGIPLAVELAAARLPVLGMRGLAERIGQRFRLLASSSPLVPTRQQTLLAALDWSHDLLSPEEQKVFRRLGVFAGDFSLELATAVVRDASIDEWTAIDALGALVDRSLVEVDAAEAPRYRLLESARAYALLKMASDELQATQRALAAALLATFERAELESWSWLESEWITTYGAELENMRAALDWSMGHDPGLAVALLGCARFLHSVHGLDFEIRLRCERMDPGPGAPAAVEARYWLARATVVRLVNWESTLSCALRAAELFAGLGDDMMRYIALSIAALNQSLEVARSTCAEYASLERADFPPRAKYMGLLTMASIAMRDGRDADAQAILEQSVELAQACGSELLLRRSLGNVADLALAMGNVERAVRVGRELMASTPERHYHAMVVRGNLANALLQSGKVAEAREALASWCDLARATQWETLATFAPVLPLLAACEGRHESAARLLGYARRRMQEETGGEPEVNERRAFDLALAEVEARLDAAMRERLANEGAALGEEAVCALALELSGATAPAATPTPASRRTPSREIPGVPRR